VGRAFHETTQKMSESRLLVGLLRMYFPRNWEFGSALSKLRNFGVGGGGLNTPNPLGTPLVLREDIRRVSDVVSGSAADCYVREVCLSGCVCVCLYLIYPD
jgi:hypothetical protein